MTVVEYEDTDGSGWFSFEVGPDGVGDKVLSITNPGNVKFVGPGGPLK